MDDLEMSVAQIIERLKILHDKLENEGMYVSANTVWLAIQALTKSAL